MSMDEEKEKIRKTISSVLLSTPLTLTIGQLIKEYRDVIGTNIPFQKFGYKSVEHFLRSTSAFEIYGQGLCAQIKAKVTSKAAHIDKLVVEQKVNVPKPRRKKISRPPIRRYQSSQLPSENPKKDFSLPSTSSMNKTDFSFPNTSAANKTNSSFPNTCTVNKTESSLLNTTAKNRSDFSVPSTSAVNKTDFSFPSTSAINKTNFSFPSTSTVKQTQGINLPPYLDTSQLRPKPRTNKSTFIPPQIEKKYNRNSYCKPLVQDYDEMEKSPKQNIASRNLDIDALPSTSDNVCLENYFSSLSDDIKTTAKKSAAESATKSASPDDVFVSDSEDEDYVNYQVPAEVQDNLRILIKDYREGLWCNELPNAYKERFRKTLDHMDYGYKTLMALCMDLDRIFHCIRPDRGDIKLYDKSKPLPLNAENSLNFTDLLKNTEIVDYPKDNALPDVSDFIMYKKQSEMPPEVVHLLEELPRQWISEDIKPMSFIDIDVGEIYDPSKFWIILRGPETSQKLDAMMDEMQEFYCVQKELQIPENKLELGLYCAAVILDEFHRGIIVHLLPHIEGQIKVFFVDYGTVSPILTKDVYYLHRKFFVLPQQAIRARLANIYPPTEKMQWSRESASAFLEMVFQKPMVAQIYRIDEKRKALELFVADTTGDEDYYVNDRLTELGHAIFTYQEQIPVELPPNEEPKVRFIHLFPSFDELEQGLVPTAVQMQRMLETGVELHHIYPWYYKNSDDLEDFSNWPKPTPQKRESTTNISRYTKKSDELNLVDDLMDLSPNQQFFSGSTEPLIDLMSNYDYGANSYENMMSTTSAYNYPVLTPEVLPNKAENNYNTNFPYNEMNTEVAGLSNLDFQSDSKSLPYMGSNLDGLKKQTEAERFSKACQDFPFEEFSYNTNLTPSTERRLYGVENETETSYSPSAISLKAHEDNSSYKLTDPCSSSQKNDKKMDVLLTDLPSSNYPPPDNNNLEAPGPSEKLKSPQSPSESSKMKTPSPKLGKSKKKSKSGKKIESNVSQKNASENIQSQSNVTVPKTIRPPPGFEGTLNVTTNSTHNMIPSVQQNFINVYLGNLQSAVAAAAPTFYPPSLNPLGVAPNVLQQQLLLQEMIRNQMMIENFRRQQQMIVQQEQNQSIVAEQMALLQQMASQLYLNGDNKDNCQVITPNKKTVIKIDFYEKSLHLIRYMNEIYCSVQEVQKVYFGDKWPIIKLKRHIAVTDPSIRIGNFHKNECMELTQELLRAGVVTDEELSNSMCLLHLVTFKDLPKLINAVSHSKLNFQNFDKYLLKYDPNSEAWL